MTVEQKKQKHERFIETNNKKYGILTIDGVEYLTFHEAIDKLGLTDRVIRGRVKSDKIEFINWVRIKK